MKLFKFVSSFRKTISVAAKESFAYSLLGAMFVLSGAVCLWLMYGHVVASGLPLPDVERNLDDEHMAALLRAYKSNGRWDYSLYLVFETFGVAALSALLSLSSAAMFDLLGGRSQMAVFAVPLMPWLALSADFFENVSALVILVSYPEPASEYVLFRNVMVSTKLYTLLLFLGGALGMVTSSRVTLKRKRE